MRNRIETPWGAADDVRHLGEHIVLVDTPSHGGLRLDEEAQKALPAAVAATLMNGPMWAEEDCELPIVLVALRRAGFLNATDVAGVFTWSDLQHFADVMVSRFDDYRPAAPYVFDMAKAATA
ncbi:MAG: hypothetical protein OXF93_23490 [Acidobacteria bacterium]|nr:hypothetical protein [Acidobacteriota bacterium]